MSELIAIWDMNIQTTRNSARGHVRISRPVPVWRSQCLSRLHILGAMIVRIFLGYSLRFFDKCLLEEKNKWPVPRQEYVFLV